MSIEIKAPTFPESVQDGTVATWYKKVGDSVVRDEHLVDIETDKVVLEVVAPADGVLANILKGEGSVILSNEIIAHINEGVASATATVSAAGSASSASAASSASNSGGSTTAAGLINPAAQKMASEKGIDVTKVAGTGKDGRVTKEDVINFDKTKPQTKVEAVSIAAVAEVGGLRVEKRVPMTRLRARIAERLLDAKQNTAMLTTFNEVNMGPVMALRSRYKDSFEKVHKGTKLGFMGFFVKAAVEALRRIPAVNASIDGNDIVYHGYQDVGVAVSTEKGLVVPVLRNAENMSVAEVENTIRDFGLRARDGKLSIDEMTGGTFTITNGGVFGSLMSTPILNPPQAAILGMHKIQDRPMAVSGKVEILPMMYLALSYDHRLIDGKEAVQFLVAIKDMIEDPARILLEV
jgi:2-oxoglutarate dehydrogenase E2 component (dihydrolipoamide succinyltransferase)